MVPSLLVGGLRFLCASAVVGPASLSRVAGWGLAARVPECSCRVPLLRCLPQSAWVGRAGLGPSAPGAAVSARTVRPPVVAVSSDPRPESLAISPPASARALLAMSLAALLGCGGELLLLLGELLLLLLSSSAAIGVAAARAGAFLVPRALTSAAAVVKICLFVFWRTKRDQSSHPGNPQRKLLDSHCADATNVF